MKKIWVKVFMLLFFIFSAPITIGNAQEVNSQNITQIASGTYSIDYQVRGRYLDSLQKAYGNEITIERDRINGWKLSVENIVKVSDTEYIITCTYLMKGISYPPPMIEAKLLIYLTDDGNVQKIDHKSFEATKWPNGEWKTNMIFYKQ